jgi:hypothetical protein
MWNVCGRSGLHAPLTNNVYKDEGGLLFVIDKASGARCWPARTRL